MTDLDGREPFVLPAGSYTISAQTYAETTRDYVLGAALTEAPGFVWVEGRHSNGSGLFYPTIVSKGSTSSAQWFGPNLLLVE